MRHMILSLIACLSFGCSGFLDEVDKDKLVPSKTEHYAAVLLQELSYEFNAFRGIDHMSDNVDEYSYASESSKIGWKPIYTWQIEIEMDENGKRNDLNNAAWENLYRDIATINYVIEFVKDATGSQQERDFVKGEALFHRANSYFLLVNLYGQPYRSESAHLDLGVPLRVDNGIVQVYHRASVLECYEQIIKDLEEAAVLLQGSGLEKSKYHPNLAACELLLSRVYLYMERWEEAEDYAARVIEKAPLSKLIAGTPFVTADRSEVLFSTIKQMGVSDASLYEAKWRVSPELIDLYDKSDLRLQCYFERVSGLLSECYIPIKRTSSFTSLGMASFRSAEAYLNRAEARWHLDQDPTTDIRTLLEGRYKDKTQIVLASGKDGQFVQIQDERRKELCFEDHHRWFDLRRMRNRPTIYHQFTRTDNDGNNQGTERFTLFPEDLNYTLPIPLKERDNNPLIKNNERYDKIPENI